MRIITLILIMCILVGCTQQQHEQSQEPGLPVSVVSSRAEEQQPEVSEVIDAPSHDESSEYIREVAKTVVKKLTRPGMNEPQLAQAAYEYIIANTYFAQPIGLDVWRFRGSGETPTYVENRAISPLLFGIGSCEDYAAALVILLEEMGMEARYVPGLTYSVGGEFVDHAWTIAKIDGNWYHLDSQLEDNVTRGDLLNYRYFMRGDETMYASHRWGENLIDCGLLTETQNNEVRDKYLYELCYADFPTPAQRSIRSAPMPNISALNAEIDAERREYERINGRLLPIELNIIPPVFKNDTYPPQS